MIALGSWVGGGWLKGQIDEVALFNYAMSQAQIQQAMNGLRSGKAVQNSGKLATCWSFIKL